MLEPEQETAEATAKFFVAKFGASAVLEASVCGHQALLQKDIDLCRFWRSVLERIEASSRLRKC
jgi:hypothetical protein